MSKLDDDKLRDYIGKLMANGLDTITEPFPEDNHQFERVLVELRQVDGENLDEKLRLSGFVDHPYGENEQRCLECMYYLVHRKWCDLPELDLPVEANWWCRLWRI